MKIGIFGDSYMDFRAYQDYAWPILLKEHYNDKFLIEGISGSSHWYSYRNFLKNFQHFDVIIFGHTSSSRWPSLPEEYKRLSYNVRSVTVGSVKIPEYLRNVNKYYNDLFPRELLSFISLNIFNSVNELCLEHNKYLINMQLFEESYHPTSTCFPLLKNINTVSAKEILKISDTKEKSMHTVICEESNIDLRACHLSKDNNRILADILKDLIDNKKYNQILNLEKDILWNYRDSHNTKLFEKYIQDNQ
jgi:hypothetical protein